VARDPMPCAAPSLVTCVDPAAPAGLAANRSGISGPVAVGVERWQMTANVQAFLAAAQMGQEPASSFAVDAMSQAGDDRFAVLSEDQRASWAVVVARRRSRNTVLRFA
jgi:hypothetical protein